MACVRMTAMLLTMYRYDTIILLLVLSLVLYRNAYYKEENIKIYLFKNIFFCYLRNASAGVVISSRYSFFYFVTQIF